MPQEISTHPNTIYSHTKMICIPLLLGKKMITLLFLCTETATTTPPAPPPPIQRVSLGHSQVTLLYCNHHHSQLKYSHKAYQQRDAFVHCAVYLWLPLWGVSVSGNYTPLLYRGPSSAPGLFKKWPRSSIIVSAATTSPSDEFYSCSSEGSRWRRLLQPVLWFRFGYHLNRFNCWLFRRSSEGVLDALRG